MGITIVFISMVIRLNCFSKMWCISLPRILQNNDLQCWIKTAGVITNDGFPECIILYNALGTMHAGEAMHCKPCYNIYINIYIYIYTCICGLFLQTIAKFSFIALQDNRIMDTVRQYMGYIWGVLRLIMTARALLSTESTPWSECMIHSLPRMTNYGVSFARLNSNFMFFPLCDV